MRFAPRTLFLFLILGGLTSTAFGQLFNLNPPVITGQRPAPLVTGRNIPVTIAFQNLRVSDPDILVPPYPQGYTLTVIPGSNYTLSGATVTPDNNFEGTLTVQVMVNDGKFDSNIFGLKIDVLNITPVVTAHESISIKEGTSVTLLLSHLKVADADNVYPDDFTLTVYDGPDYSRNGTTVIPDAGFSGPLKVMVSVNDGQAESNKFEVTINVKNNIIPKIVRQHAMSSDQGKKIIIAFSNLEVDDPDNNYPADFSLKAYEGPNYIVNGVTITPSPAFVGTLRVPVTVHDGIDESKKFELRIEVRRKNNVRPEIIAQNSLVANEDHSITINLTDLNVSDPDNDYPADFTLKIPQGAGENYTVSGTMITPNLNYHGPLEIPIRVNDGLDDSAPFQLAVTIKPVNDVPVITGQREMVIRSNRSTILDISRLDITDPDNENTTGFTLKILPGTDYTGNGNVITPAAGYVGTLTVTVVVNDGEVDSAPYDLEVEVVPGGSAPLITGQQSLVMNEDETIKLKLEDLIVTDDDDTYPIGFTMQVHPGMPPTDYTYQGLGVTPKLNLNGLLTVYVTVNDGNEDSDPFALTIYILPVNDAPEITSLDQTKVHYEPGTGPVSVSEDFAVNDVDNGYLNFAEAAIGDSTFDAAHDELIFESTERIRGVYDRTKGILSLIGNAPLAEYDTAIRSVKYNYILTLDEDGNQSEVLPGEKSILFSVNDGQLASEKKMRSIVIESSADLDIPNAFTPNGDRSNDTWHVRPAASSNQFDRAIVKVYNKKGLLLYESKGIEKSWDGSFKGEMLPVGTYYYTIDLNLSYTKKTYKGTVTILK